MESDSQQSDIEEVKLHIDGQIFVVKKELLCEHSDYFRAMFSGNYVEKKKHDIIINVIDAASMELIVKYMNIGLIDLSEYTLPVIGNLAMAANFLQIMELIKQIQYCLDLQLCITNWVEIMSIAENAAYTKLEQLAASYGLFSFKDMKPEYIPTLQKLHWYLSHPSLNTPSEVDVFRFGMKWVLHPDTCCCAEILIVVLGCLDVTKLTRQDIKEISILVNDCEETLAAQVVDCLKLLLDNKLQVHLSILVWYKKEVIESYSEKVYNETYNIIKDTITRNLVFTPVVPMWKMNNGKLDLAPHYMYTYKPGIGFHRWLEVADKNLWGWSCTAWGLNKLVVMGGEYGRGSGQFMRDVRIYDTLRKEWTHHGVELPQKRHGGITVCGDSLFIIGGVGAFRLSNEEDPWGRQDPSIPPEPGAVPRPIVPHINPNEILQDSAILYNLRERTFRNIASFPDTIQSPAVCTHYDTVYVASHKDIYKYEDLGEVDRWVSVMSTQMRPNRLVSFGDYIYCTQNYFSPLYRFRPGIDRKLQMVTQFTAPPVAFANMGNSLIVFTKTISGEPNEQLRVEEYKGPCMCKERTCTPGTNGCGPNILTRRKSTDITFNEISGACALVMEMPEIHHELSEYHEQYLTKYGHITYDSR